MNSEQRNGPNPLSLYSVIVSGAMKVSKGCKDQESIQSSTTPDPGYQWESKKFTVRHHKRKPIGILGQVWYLIVSIPDLCSLFTIRILINIYGNQIVLIIDPK